jgi:parvulin-like peptidyl-prolyl isomerase
MKQVLFSLKVGDITDALRHDNGYYVFRVEASDVLPYEKVRDEIYKSVQAQRFQQWQDELRAGTSVQFENEAFFQNIGKK